MTTRIIARDPRGGEGWVRWRNPKAVVTATRPAQVLHLLARIDAATRAGDHAVGFLTYEAAAGLDDGLAVHVRPPGTLPLAWFGLFGEPEPYLLPSPGPPPIPVRWPPAVNAAAYHRALAHIKKNIAAGETYQVNYTMPLVADGPVDLWALFLSLYHRQPSPYAIYVHAPRFRLASVSPELFFERDGQRIAVEPMKGTCPRAPHAHLDATAGLALSHCSKNRAENLMIVDMMRNDLGKVAVTGSVQTTELFKVTPWPTLWQMTSRIEAISDADLPALMTALFPCASITGAPKRKTMEIIQAREVGPRGVYTGAIGWVGPRQRARFSVGIRTAVQEAQTGQTVYGIGSGIVWDSRAADERRECLLKARILQRDRPPAFRLLETLRWERKTGYFWLEYHVNRMLSSASFFGFPLVRAEVISALESAAKTAAGESGRVRLLADRRGRVQAMMTCPAPPAYLDDPARAAIIRAALDAVPQQTDSPWLYHKTTRRERYRAAMNRHPGMDEVLLVNQRDEVMEFTTGNLVGQRDGRWYTPPLSSGLLPGVFREHLLVEGRLEERVIAVADIGAYTDFYCINSLRGWRRVSGLGRAGMESSR